MRAAGMRSRSSIESAIRSFLAVFPELPGKRALIVSAGDPMWRGGLSGPVFDLCIPDGR